jgi:hypothetical protein
MTIVIVVAASAAFAATADLPKTGQTTVSTAGDDGDLKKGIAWPGQRFTTNADTTVTDNLTSLVWAPNAETPTFMTCTGGMMKWQDVAAFPALQYVACLNTNNYLGRADWRLPNINELESLVHAEYTRESCSGSPCGTNAAWLNTQGFNGTVQSSSYWSSTAYVLNAGKAWFVSMAGGDVLYGDKSDYCYVWPVRGGQ